MKRMLWVILMMSIGTTFTSPLFPLYQEHYRLSSLQITVLFAVYALFLLPSLLISGSRGSGWGLKRVLRFSMWLSILATLVFMGSQQAWLVYAARILEGIAYGIFTGTSVAFLLQQTPKEQTGKALMLSGMTVSVGFGLGPAITGLVIQYLHLMPLRVPFWILTLFLLSGLITLETLKDRDFEARKQLAKTPPAPVSLGVPDDIRRPFWSFSTAFFYVVYAERHHPVLDSFVCERRPSFVELVGIRATDFAAAWRRRSAAAAAVRQTPGPPSARRHRLAVPWGLAGRLFGFDRKHRLALGGRFDSGARQRMDVPGQFAPGRGTAEPGSPVEGRFDLLFRRIFGIHRSGRRHRRADLFLRYERVADRTEYSCFLAGRLHAGIFREVRPILCPAQREAADGKAPKRICVTVCRVG